ncbi:hypothetical protein N7532_009644 [Penicillium argentinense]|uniref:L-ornithine N(5)-oxygenase n=1 Tax=Penicillium argentinense TaxID=1131581 RepID=A0A9W9K323_9EURO|nr:uncharacterized protein N7532_009644 [Penicillium argentinense]KAJ5090960.1 hypothetical protein N7532_009644 [Penicillium argentinense]
MERVLIVVPGLYGLVAAKTYLQVRGVYDQSRIPDDDAEIMSEIPTGFLISNPAQQTNPDPSCSLLVVDSASDIGGTWGEERLYPNLVSQNTYGLYEYSDLPLAEVVPPEQDHMGAHFIAGWKINRYLHVWADKWDLKKHIRLGWQVDTIRRLDNKIWQLNIRIMSGAHRDITIFCDKLILATGLTSVPNLPQLAVSPEVGKSGPVIHAKHIGDWAHDNLGYQSLPDVEILERETANPKLKNPRLRSVVIYGGAKSSFDLVHFFAKLHQQDRKLHLKVSAKDPINVHWIIRNRGAGPSWMAPPTSTLPNGEIVASDKAASTRFIHYLDPCSYEMPKRAVLRKSTGRWFWDFHLEGSWRARFFHGNPLGRRFLQQFWQSLDQNLEGIAQYDANPKMRLLRPDHSIISCNSTIGIANQADLWETIRSPHVSIHRSTIDSISHANVAGDSSLVDRVTASLENGTCLEDIDLVVHATGYKPVVPIDFEPENLRMRLGFPDLLDPGHGKEDQPRTMITPNHLEPERRIQHWKAMDLRSEKKIQKILKATGCVPGRCHDQSSTSKTEVLPYRLFRRMVAPELVAEGDRSFAVLGVVLTSTIAIVAEIQALWIAAFLTEKLETMDQSISEDVVLGRVTGSEMQVDAIQYNDILMRDLGLNPHRLGGGFWRELTGVYEPSAYAGIVEEWRKVQQKN